MTPFTHLHVHTEYSLLDGACRIEQLVDRVAALGQKSIAITDHGVMYGVVDFYRACKKKGIKPIIGCEVYVAPESRFSRAYRKGERHAHLILLCENEVGYKNLIHLVSLGFSDGFYMRPRIDMELLSQHSEGLICLSACLAGAVPRDLIHDDYEGAYARCEQFLQIFDREHFYLEVQDHGIPLQKKVNEGLFRLATELNIHTVATNDAHYLTRFDAKLHDVLMCIQMGKTIDDPDRMRFPTDEFYIKSGEEMQALFADHPEAIENTQKIALRCNMDFAFGKYHLPEFDVPDGGDALTYLQELCERGFAQRYPKDDGTVRKRMQYELDMIAQMGFVDYFLIVSDFIGWAKQNGISVGPGRGSAAGSVVSYCLGITDLDPIYYSLYFERFLNPERVSMPDIDVDFCYERRGEVIDYVTSKYGADKVSQIVTFGTMAARGAIRDVGRVMNLPYAEVDAVAKQVPTELHITIDKALSANPELKKMYDTKPQVRELIDTARALEGVPRHASTHAAGVVITKQPVDTYVPLSKNGDQMVTEFSMVTLEELGLLKMDFLGLRTLTVIADAERMVKNRHPDFSIEQIPTADAATYEMLGRGQTVGVFQLESAGITNVVTGLKPHSIEDITAVVALYRPGPMQSIPTYIECRHNPEKVRYKHPLLEPILKVTYGCMVYQEQVMQVFQDLAGYPLGKADMVRRAMSKKKMKELERERITFLHGDAESGIEGAIARGVPEQVAASIFDEIMDFANYAFNKAHAVCYAVVSYRTAYLKCHYPKEFMAALLTSVLDNSDKVSGYIHAAREMGIEVMPPDINLSQDSFTVAEGRVHFGLAAVKGVGRGFMKRLMQERGANGAFSTFQNFCERMAGQELNRKTVESLIKAGAFDAMGYYRSQLLAVMGAVLDGIVQSRKKNIDGQMDLFGMADTPAESREIALPAIEEVDQKTKLVMEKETTGLYLSGHPMDEYRALARQAEAVPLRKIIDDLGGEADTPFYKDGMQVYLACVLTSVRLRSTKNGAMMAYAQVEDDSGSLELVIFPKALQQCGSYLTEDSAVLVNGRIDARDEEPPKIILNEAFPLTQSAVDAVQQQRHPNRPVLSDSKAAALAPQQLYLKIPSIESEQWTEIRQLLQKNAGETPVYLYPVDKQRKTLVARKLWCRPDVPMLEKLRVLLGEQNVVIQSKAAE